MITGDLHRVLRLRRRRFGQPARAAYDRELKSIAASPLAQLKTMVDEAASQGRDLVAENVRRLRRDITAARNRLDAMRWNP